MPKIVILGSSAAIPAAGHANTQFLVMLDSSIALVDCGDNTWVRLDSAGISADQVSDLFLTHFHPDHAGGLPALLITLWLLKRQAPLTLHGLEDTLDRAENVLNQFQWEEWPGMYPVRFNRLPTMELAPVLETEEWKVSASPVQHLIPTIGLRMEFAGGTIAAYSSDSEPCAEVMRLASGANLLLHEAAGESRGHSSGTQAAEVARQAQVQRLSLIHYPLGKGPQMLEQAQAIFAGEVSLAEDGTVYVL